ncbi:FHA domain-containing protein [Agromyces laixinhei]|uniref:FHA domain-containing protein n=1 Tax=Agromyces laixinhei TaxID=2585717 RepID=UPI001115FB21|nr:FHA domain-containing protein [Agromyces laixinhei]
MPAQFQVEKPAPAPRADTPKPSPAAPLEPVPLPRSLPWQQPGARIEPPAAVPAAVAPIERVELLFSTGQRVVVEGSAVIGRKPADTALAMGARAVEVVDDTRSVSRVHLFLDVQGGQITVGDAGSANGSRVERAGAVLPLESAGTRITLEITDTIWLGDLSFVLRAA